MVKADQTMVVERRVETKAEFCSEHGERRAVSCYNAKAIIEAEENCKKTVNDVYTAIGKKTPLWAFLGVLGLLTTILLAMFSTLNETHREVASMRMTLDNRLTILEERQNVVNRTLNLYFENRK